MTADELLIEVSRLHIRLERRGDNLHVSAPPGAVTPALRAELVRQKPELLARLTLPEVEFVTLKPGLVVALPAMLLALDLERRGIALRTDSTHEYLVAEGPALTAEDHAGVVRWHRHLAALVAYRAPEVPQ